MDSGGGKKQERAVIVYDGTCPVCSQAMTWVRENELSGAFEMVRCQEEGLSGRVPKIRTEACMQAMQLVLPGGKILSGEQALPEVLGRLRSRRYRKLGTLLRLPGFHAASSVLYRWFARHRYGIAHLLEHSRRLMMNSGGGRGKRV